MQPFAVVEADDIVRDVPSSLGVVGVVALPDPLHLQVQEEALHHCVVPAVSFAAHARACAMAGQQRAVGFAGVLAASIRVDDQPGRRPALGDGHPQSGTDQLGRHARGHRPADDLAREQVHHHRQIQPAAAGTQVGNVGDPCLVRARGVELPVQHIGRHRQAVPAIGRVHELAMPDRAQPVFTHQPANPMAAKLQPFGAQHLQQPAAAVTAA